MLGDDIIDIRTVAEVLEDADFDSEDYEDAAKIFHAFQEDVGGFRSYVDEGLPLINDGYFETYTEELAYDVGAVSPDATWPVKHIDWEAAAEELKHDYHQLEVKDGYKTHRYWIRAL